MQRVINLGAIKALEQRLDAVLQQYSELRTAHPTRQQALEEYLMAKPTGRPVGRPKTKEYSTLLARVPQDVIDRVKAYAEAHHKTISELIRNGLEWRISVCPQTSPQQALQCLSGVPPAVPQGIPYDAARFVLGTLCKYGHGYGETGQSLRDKSGDCVECKRVRNARRQRGHGKEVGG
jgi:hypothetical protein